jgi:hypothetical protein
MVDQYVQEAFHRYCRKARPPRRHFVCLMERRPYYGGPEEGGWWGSDSILVAFQEFPSKRLAVEAEKAVEKLAYEMSQKSRTEFGKQCLREMEWLEERGLEPDFLPEPDGESQFYVMVTREIPENHYGCRHYE